MPSPRNSRFRAAKRPNSIRRVFSGCSVRETLDLTAPGADRLFLIPLVKAGIVTGDAIAHEVAAPSTQLVRGFGIGDQLTGPADQVRLAVAQPLLNALLRADTAEGDDRQLDSALERRAQPFEVGARDGGGQGV